MSFIQAHPCDLTSADIVAATNHEPQRQYRAKIAEILRHDIAAIAKE